MKQVPHRDPALDDLNSSSYPAFLSSCRHLPPRVTHPRSSLKFCCLQPMSRCYITRTQHRENRFWVGSEEDKRGQGLWKSQRTDGGTYRLWAGHLGRGPVMSAATEASCQQSYVLCDPASTGHTLPHAYSARLSASSRTRAFLLRTIPASTCLSFHSERRSPVDPFVNPLD